VSTSAYDLIRRSALDEIERAELDPSRDHEGGPRDDAGSRQFKPLVVPVLRRHGGTIGGSEEQPAELGDAANPILELGRRLTRRPSRP
jgi:hypothetical protein